MTQCNAYLNNKKIKIITKLITFDLGLVWTLLFSQHLFNTFFWVPKFYGPKFFQTK